MTRLPAACTFILILLTGCPRTPPSTTSPGDPTTGSGGSSSASTSTAGGAPPDLCVHPLPVDPEFGCRFDSDCYDGSQCTEDVCEKGRCGYRVLTGNCDQGLGWHGECRGSSCCPRATVVGGQ